jgi:hypothetical protein
MSRTFQADVAYGEAMALNESAAADSHFEAAYHFLMAALHCAEDMENTEQLAEVAALARAQQSAVDAVNPPHPLSTHRPHASRGIFEMAAIEAEAVIKRLKAAQWIATRRSRQQVGSNPARQAKPGL